MTASLVIAGIDWHSAATASYIVAALLFILSLAGLSRHESARQGVAFGIAGMAIALIATIGVATEQRARASRSSCSSSRSRSAPRSASGARASSR